MLVSGGGGVLNALFSLTLGGGGASQCLNSEPGSEPWVNEGLGFLLFFLLSLIPTRFCLVS